MSSVQCSELAFSLLKAAGRFLIALKRLSRPIMILYVPVYWDPLFLYSHMNEVFLVNQRHI